MPKIKLGAPPKTFPHTVTYALLEGGDDCIKLQYRYRDRIEYADFIAALFPNLETGKPAVESGSGYDIRGVVVKDLQRSVDHIMGAVVSWDLDDEVSAANVARFVKEFPGAAQAVIDDYRTAIVEGRTKN